MANGTNKDTLRTQIKQHILKGITEGKYKRGERIVETRLAKELQVSQAPVREAILELCFMGLLEERPYSGSYVRIMDADEIEDYFNARAYIEEYAAKRAAKYITEEELKKMRFILNEMDSCGSMEQFVALDHQFHEAVMEAAKNKALKRAWDTLATYEWTYESTLATSMSLKELSESHRQLYDGIASGKDHTAGAYMFLHISGFGTEIISRLHEQQDTVPA